MRSSESSPFTVYELCARWTTHELMAVKEQRSETALTLGTYLTPRLCASYGVGLFETLNILQIRYRLGRHWLLQTETGTASDADVLYTIER